MTFAPENWARRHSMALAERLHIAGHRASFVSVQRHTGYHWIRACFYSWKVCNSNKKFWFHKLSCWQCTMWGPCLIAKLVYN